MRDKNTKYKFAPTDAGAFFFPTDDSCYYTISIMEAGYKLWKSAKLTDDDKVFELSFDTKCDENDPGLDESICNTITHIFISNIASKGDLFVYYHILEQNDKYAAFYEHFYNDIEEQTDFEVHERTAAPEGGEEPYTISVVIHKRNPDSELIMSEFEKAISEYY